MRKKQQKGTKRRLVGSVFLSNPVYQGDNNIPTTIQHIQYNEKEMSVKDITSVEKLKPEIVADNVNWFKIIGMSDVARISKICTEFGLHGFDIRDLLSPQEVTKVVTYEKITFILMHGFYLNNENLLEDMQLAFILGENFVISMQETAIPVFDTIPEAIKENNIQIRDKKADYFLYVLLAASNTMIANTVMKIEDSLVDIEEKLLNQENDKRLMHYLHMNRSYYTSMKRAMLSLREEFVNLLHNTNKLICDSSIVYFNNYDDKLRTTLSNLDALHDTLSSLLDIYYNNNNLIMNNIIRRLTIVSTIFIPLTFLVGVWGMNFDIMPETEWKYGYALAWGIFLIIGLATLYFFKRKKWF
ncbi:magnesium/cobalt transporter CorA [Dysgonomonas sp. 25]|uniref:magnesium/cobalt transporter CorA n=1 Tax=Dysgonomonas sp. 25 TaxID=2302933 RepID=UPI0013CFC235|nr:magnesium/cobalt transporter CorA [Dysgonomonas sp. 25]NDV68367.1 magnesium and cobalt transport protein CorA [Dysgonomonas sp. 25]